MIFIVIIQNEINTDAPNCNLYKLFINAIEKQEFVFTFCDKDIDLYCLEREETFFVNHKWYVDRFYDAFDR